MTKDGGVNPPWHYRIMGRFFAPLMWRIFIKLGMLFYNQIVVRGDGKAVFYASTEWDMINGMEEYLSED